MCIAIFFDSFVLKIVTSIKNNYTVGRLTNGIETRIGQSKEVFMPKNNKLTLNIMFKI